MNNGQTRTDTLTYDDANRVATVNDAAWHHDANEGVYRKCIDLVLCRPPRLIFAELKTQRGALRPAQQAWLHALSQCPSVETYLWRPSDWHTIVRTLQRD